MSCIQGVACIDSKITQVRWRIGNEMKAAWHGSITNTRRSIYVEPRRIKANRSQNKKMELT